MTVVSGADLEFAELPGRRSADPLEAIDSASSVRVVELERTAGRTAHRHPQSEEVVYVAAGHGEMWIDGARHPVGPGDVVHVPTGAAHATVPAADSSMRLICFFPHGALGENLENLDIQVTEER